MFQLNNEFSGKMSLVILTVVNLKQFIKSIFQKFKKPFQKKEVCYPFKIEIHTVRDLPQQLKVSKHSWIEEGKMQEFSRN